MKNITVDVVITNYVTPLKSSNSIQDALAVIAQYSISSVVITDEQNFPIGIFTEHDLLNAVANSIDLSTPLVEVMSKNLFTIQASMPLHDAYILLENRGFRHLIVVNKDGLYVGIISEGDFLRQMGFEHIGTSKNVQAVMSETPLMISSETLINEAAKLMSERRSNSAIITQNKQPKAILSERDISYYCAQQNFSKSALVSDIEHSQMHLVSQSISLKNAAMMMEEHGTHQLVVVDSNNNIIGLLNRNNILKAIHGAYFNFLVELIDKKSADLTITYDNKKLLSDVINTIPDLVWMKDVDGRFLACNHMFERLLNAKESDILGKTDFDFVNTEMATFFRDHDRRAMTHGDSQSNEEYLVFADQSHEGLFHTIKTPMKDDEGTILGVLGVARDISELKKREDDLKQKDSDLNEAQTLAHVGSWSIDGSSDTLKWSDECYRIFGIEIGSEIDYDSFFDTVHPDDRDNVDQAWSTALVNSRYDIEHRIIVGDTIKWIRSKAKLQIASNHELISVVGTVQDISKRKLYEEELEHLANYDSLTNLANRSFLLSHLQKSIHMASRHNRTIALLIFDLDHFKDINDSFGHATGDELLKIVAARFTERIRKGDLIARLGGDEFAVILEHISRQEDAAQVALEMIDVLSQPYLLSNKLEVHIGASVGIAIAPQHSSNAEELLQYADTALYKAKSEGRSTYSYYSDELTSAARERILCENRLRRAIEKSEFELYYQPQVHIKTGRIIGTEALIRWNDPELGMISPNQFIPLAEETGLISEIGAWVLLQACEQGKLWQDQGHNLHVSVNVSAHQVHHQDLIKLVDTTLKQSGFNAEKLTLELTESAMMQREEEVVATLHALRAKGIRLAIDDFGTGYSSYSYLKRFPIDILKIDKSFIDDIPYENDDMAIVKAIIAMGTAMGYQILAEGTEEIEQIEFLQEHGCTYYQGYYKSKPLPADEFEKLLEDHS